MGLRKLGSILPALLCGSVLVSAHPEKPRPPRPPEPVPSICACKPRVIGASRSRIDWDGYGKGIRWHYSVVEAMKIAKVENKLVFWYLVVGDLDKEGC